MARLTIILGLVLIGMIGIVVAQETDIPTLPTPITTPSITTTSVEPTTTQDITTTTQAPTTTTQAPTTTTKRPKCRKRGQFCNIFSDCCHGLKCTGIPFLRRCTKTRENRKYAS